MAAITKFDRRFTQQLPQASRLLIDSNLVVHPLVERISLHGSRGPKNSARPDSDFDLCLHVDIDPTMSEEAIDGLLRTVLEFTSSEWQGPAEIDLAAVYALRPGGLDCFERSDYDSSRCPFTASGHFGLYKIQKGFDGFVDGEAVRVEMMYPCMIIWRRSPEFED